MRLLHLPNEPTDGYQIGPRRAFDKLFKEGALSAYLAYSYLVRDKELPTHTDALNELMGTAKDFQPDVIFIQHINRIYPVDTEYLRRLKALPSKPKIIYHEGDAYGRFIKRVDSVMKALIAESDMVFIAGMGYLAKIFTLAGAKRVRYIFNSIDDVRIDPNWVPTRVRALDAVMVANLPCLKKIPWLHMPGGKNRKRLAKAYHKALGDRFAVYGSGLGWKGVPYCRGGVGFDQQAAVMRDAWISLAWDHFDKLPMYSSDRLPISLASGVLHITNKQPGYEYVFGDIPGLYMADSVADAVDIGLYLLSLPIDKRIEISLASTDYVRSRLHADVVYRNVINLIRDEFF